MSLRVSRLVLTPVLLNEHDALVEADPIVFQGDAEGSAADKLRDWLDMLPDKLREAGGGSA